VRSGSNPTAALQRVADLLVSEQLVTVTGDGRPRPSLARAYSTSDDGLVLRVSLRPGLKFHDGRVLDAATVAGILKEALPASLGPLYEDIAGFEIKSDTDFEIRLHRPSALVLEGLDTPVTEPGSPHVGTGPYRTTVASDSGIEMEANQDYYQGRPIIDHISIKPYSSVRSAWADMLRGQIDMLYEVGLDALDSLQPSSAIHVYTFTRRYAYAVLFNVRKPTFQDQKLRRALNMAVDRKGLVTTALQGHGEPDDSSVWPGHWAIDPSAPRFEYQPAESSHRFANGKSLRFKCLTIDGPPYERLALALQRQLDAVGVTMEIEPLPLDKLNARWEAGDFEALLFEFRVGAMSDQYRFWHSGGSLNHGGFSSRVVDSYLDAIRHSTSDAAYKSGMAGFQRAIVNDPPAVFLAWGERARAVSRRFDIPVERTHDIMFTLRQWRPTNDEKAANRN
jgi:peptide/nickel transport system substrate-binding protein